MPPSRIERIKRIFEAALSEIAGRILEENPAQVAAYHAGKGTLIGWFVGQMMRQSGRITSYNVCYTKLLRGRAHRAPDSPCLRRRAWPAVHSPPARARSARFGEGANS